MRKLYLHIGTEKTGTTSIQQFLTKNYSSLLSKHNILYPDHPVLFDKNAHFPMAGAFLNPLYCDFVEQNNISNPNDISKTLLEEYDKYNPNLMVLSAEHFSSRFMETDVSNLSKILSSFHVKIIVYVRRQDSMALSSFSTGVWTGRRNWFDIAEVTPNCPRYNIIKMLLIWGRYFGNDQIELRIFNNKTTKKTWNQPMISWEY